jgi:hypothetical protein
MQMLPTLRESGLSFELLPIETKAPSIAYSIPQLEMLLFFFHHPSRNWLARQWESDVVPCLSYLRQTGEINLSSYGEMER